MYRRLESSLPPDFKFASDLHGMGYFINDKDQIRMIDDLEQPFHYHASKNKRFVEMQKEAMNECIRGIVNERLKKLGMLEVPLPWNTPKNKAHVPILVSENLWTAERVVVLLGESNQDRGILAGRIISNESINLGSAVNLASDVLAQSASAARDPALKEASKTALIIASPGQLLWWRRGRKALSFISWYAIPRKSAMGDGVQLTAKNKIPRNGTPFEHIRCLFDDILTPLAHEGKKLSIIAVRDAIDELVCVLDSNFEKYGSGLEAVVCTSSYVYQPQITDSGLAEFWGKRARAYIVDCEPLGTPMTGRQELGCNVYSSGVTDFVECVVPRAYREILDYFKLVHSQENYENVPQNIPGYNTDNDAVQNEITWAVKDGDGVIDVSEDEEEGGSA